MTRHAAAIAAILVASPIVTTGASATIIIDDFTDVSFAWPATVDSVSFIEQTETGLSGVLGGQRHSRLELEQMDAGVDEVSLTVEPVLADGVLDYASTVGADGLLGLTYDGGGTLVADFSAEQFIAISLLDFDRASGAAMPITITLTSAGGSATQTLDATGGPQSLVFALAGFATAGAFDLADIRAVSVVFDPDFAGDFRVDSIIADVPAPGALALLAGWGLVGRRRRERVHTGYTS